VMHWKGKAALMRVFSTLPRGEALHYLAQRHITRSLPSSDEKFAEIFDRAQEHLKALARHSITEFKDTRFYEFGAGWELAIPLSFFALGVRSQILVDIRRLLRVELVNATLKKLKQMSRENGALQVPGDLLPNGGGTRWIKLLEEHYGIRYLAPRDARYTGLKDQSIEFITSTNTLEHIPPKDVELILRECRRILRRNGLMSFVIDYQDHYSYFDSDVSVYNFLQYSPGSWKWYSPPLHFQSRLRHKDYLAVMKEEGFRVIEENLKEASAGDLADLGRIRLALPFSDNYSLPELGVRSAHVVLQAA
jgi:SAM-dependent methyltransferase